MAQPPFVHASVRAPEEPPQPSRWTKRLYYMLLMGLMGLAVIYLYMMLGLPSVSALKDVRMQLPLQVYTSEHQLIATFGEKKRIPVTLEATPPLLVKAILATEDKRYFKHAGVDLIGLGRATIQLLVTGKKSQGASTITMQVARNFFLTRKKTYGRKIKEILLAIKITHSFSKKKVLTLYLNKIYLGHRAYGVAAAAQVYYGKPLSALTLPQLAMLAGLPQAPSRENPITNPVLAKKRRNHVLARMLAADDISQAQYDASIVAPITAKRHAQTVSVHAPYVAEMVRDAMVAQYGDAAYTKGLVVETTIEAPLQRAANQAMHKAIRAYDRQHGYRGPEAYWDISEAIAEEAEAQTQEDQAQAQDHDADDVEEHDVEEHDVEEHDVADGGTADLPKPLEKHALSDVLKRLKAIPTVAGMQPAVVWQLGDRDAEVLLADGQHVMVPWSGMSWARPARDAAKPGPRPQRASDVLHVGGLVRVTPRGAGWQLVQLPKIQGALVSMGSHSGDILALVGGYSFQMSHFNRVTQAKRQSGSAFKPFVYSAALAKGFTLASMFNDAPVVTDATDNDEVWRPQNHEERFYGPTRMRLGLVKSRNLLTIRILQASGLQFTRRYLKRFGFDKEAAPNHLSLALGTGVITPLALTQAYAVFANGGVLVQPHVVLEVRDRSGKLLESHVPPSVCETDEDAASEVDCRAAPPAAISPEVAYLMDSALRSVVTQGTGRRARVLKRSDLAGKTGTTYTDGWFAGYGGGVVTTVWMGFDQSLPLYAYGSQVALPAWVDAMRVALKGRPLASLPRPTTIVSVRIDPRTGRIAQPGQKAMFEIFRKDHAPDESVDTAHTSSRSEAAASDSASGVAQDAPIF